MVPVPDGGAAHTETVTPETAPDPVAAALERRTSHKQSCPACADRVPCAVFRELTAAWRRALRDSSADHAPAAVQTAEVPVE